MHEREKQKERRSEGATPATELCYGDLNGRRDLKYVDTPYCRPGNQSVQKREPVELVRLKIAPECERDVPLMFTGTLRNNFHV